MDQRHLANLVFAALVAALAAGGAARAQVQQTAPPTEQTQPLAVDLEKGKDQPEQDRAGNPEPGAEGASAGDAGCPCAEKTAEAEEPQAPRYIVEKIEIHGNEKTWDELILSYIFLKPGEVLDEEKVERSRIRLLALGYFTDVRVRLERGSSRGLVKLVVEVDERNTIIIDDLFFGTSSTNSFWGGAGISDINFLGRGLVLSLAGVASKDQQAIRLGAFWPSILASNLQAGVQGLVSWGREEALGGKIPKNDTQPDCNTWIGENQSMKYFRGGGIITGGIRLDRYHRLSLDWHLEVIHADVDSVKDQCSNYPFAGYLQGGSSFLSSLTFRFERDTRDDFFLPKNGMLLVVSVELASKVIAGSDYEYSKYMIKYEQSFPAFLDHAMRLTLVLGMIQDVGVHGSPYFVRFFVGDYALFWVDKPSLPRSLELNFSDTADYGDVLACLAAEYDIPVWSSGKFFYRGYLYAAANFAYVTKATFLSTDQEWSGRAKYPFTMDLGFKLDTPVGLFTISVGYFIDLFL